MTCLIMLTLSLSATPAPAAIVERAIAAHGGKQQLGQMQSFRVEGKGSLHLDGTSVPITMDLLVSFPGRFRSLVDIHEQALVETVLDGTRGWRKVGGSVIALGSPSLKEAQAQLDLLHLATLLPLLEPSVTLREAPMMEAAGKLAVGVEATRKGRPSVTLYFDQKTGLLVRMIRGETSSDKPASLALTFTGYRKLGQMQIPGQIEARVHGKIYIDLKVTSFKSVPRPGSEEFARP